MSKIIKLQNGAPQIVADEWTVLRAPEGGELTQADVDAATHAIDDALLRFDLSENAEYKAAKERQEIVNARIAMLKKRVGEISLMNMDRIPKGRAGFGSTVHLRAVSGEVVIYQLVMPEEADAEKGLISTSSPIGRAILNKEEGDEIKVVTPSGSREFELLKLFTIHDPDE